MKTAILILKMESEKISENRENITKARRLINNSDSIEAMSALNEKDNQLRNEWDELQRAITVLKCEKEIKILEHCIDELGFNPIIK